MPIRKQYTSKRTKNMQKFKMKCKQNKTDLIHHEQIEQAPKQILSRISSQICSFQVFQNVPKKESAQPTTLNSSKTMKLTQSRKKKTKTLTNDNKKINLNL